MPDSAVPAAANATDKSAATGPYTAQPTASVATHEPAADWIVRPDLMPMFRRAVRDASPLDIAWTDPEGVVHEERVHVISAAAGAVRGYVAGRSGLQTIKVAEISAASEAHGDADRQPPQSGCSG